ncbi:nucleoporin Nup186/Nup192/Nup205 [Ephemerocybe angulata]|uniref:Nucleoporin Nup186/Nup192/Nup205 n=1 Tax=Ephemerocybe angulata TaxID=980116 RepID=A0A8H6HM67_9AGAR|nr:nucleoporin Nup186/Nup192/Nup205 [Tulosesus angulatus]
MDSIYRLRDALSRVLAGEDDSQVDQELFEELMLQRPRLLSLLDVGQRSPQEQKEVESGRINLNGTQIAVNSDFARQAIFLAGQLDCSEKYIASVLHSVMRRNSNLDPVQCIEETVTEFHRRRRYLVEAVELLIACALRGELIKGNATLDRLTKFTRNLLKPVETAGGTVTLATSIFKGIAQLDALIAKADAAVKNATSNTVPPSSQSQGVLGADILTGRLQSLHYERRHLAISLSSIAQYGYLSPNEVISLAVLTSFDPSSPDGIIGRLRIMLATDDTLLRHMSQKLAPSTPWKEPGLKAAILLKWTMFLTEARHQDASLENKKGYRNEELETQVWNAVQGDAFMYLALSVIYMSKSKTGDGLTSSLITPPPSDTQDARETPTGEHKLRLLTTIETLVRSLIAHASSELRKIKQRQEDLVLASAQTDRARASSRFAAAQAQETDRTGQAPRHDIAILFAFIGLLFSSLPDERALQFWGAGGGQEVNQMSYMEYIESTSGRLPAFLQWAIWSSTASNQDLTMLTALYEMLSGLAKGQQCSELAYNFMVRGTQEVLPGSSVSSPSNGPTISWSSIFGILENWAAHTANPRGHSQQTRGPFSNSIHNLAPAPPPQQQQLTLGPRDVLFAQSFLRLLSTVVKYSVAVRTAITNHTHYRAIPALLNLIPLGIPLELKGALFDTVSAFCEPGGGPHGVDTCKTVWNLLEKLELINVRGSGVGKGVEVELEQIEAVHRLYPATIPFLKLLSTLLHTPKRLPEKDRAEGVVPVSTIPENLGQPYRLPGVAPFTAFVVDNIFENIPNREYSVPSDRWRINDLCLSYVERALAGFDLESLVSPVEEGPIRGEALVPLLIHPGFDIMTRLLSSTKLQQRLLAYLVDGLDGFEKNLAEDEPYFRNTIVRVLRIVLRVLDVQDIFLDVLLPLLTEFDSAAYIGQVHHRSYFTKFDQALSFSPQYAPAVAQYMEYSNHAELVLLSIRILTSLSTSPYFTNLVTLIERNPNSERILSAFVQVLSIENNQAVADAELNAEIWTGAGAPDPSDDPEPLSQGIRLAALDLLIQDTASNRAFPNVGHWLLLGSHQPQVQDPYALNSRKTSIHVLLELVNAGVPRLKEGGRIELEEHLQTSPLYLTLPALADRCYRVIYQLCTHPRTSDFVTRYLRTREDFFARQISHVPSQCPEVNQPPLIQVSYMDGSRVLTTVEALSSFLRVRSYIFDLVALELHILTAKSHWKGVIDLLDILFGTDVDYEEEHGFSTFREVGQSNMRIVDFFQSLIIEWADSLQVGQVDMQYLGSLNLQACIRKDAAGCEVVDRSIVLAMLAGAKKALVTQGSVVTASQLAQLNAETAYILESCVVENNRRQVAFSIANGFEAWRRLLDIALTKCFDRLPHDRRENMLFDLLHVLPSAIRTPTIEESTSILLSETTLTLITKLREDRRYQLVLQSSAEEAGSLPAERLYGILRDIVEGILENSHSELVRGNLYGSLINFIHLVLCSKPESDSDDGAANVVDPNDPFAASLAASSLRESSFGASQSLALVQPHRQQYTSSSSSAASLELGILSTIKPVLERLVAIISRDAIDGTEVWKTVAFMLLDAVVQLSGLEKQHSALASLSRHGVLLNFVHGLKEADGLLQAVLKPDPEDLSPLYVYESKMSLFIRMAQTRLGAERLLEAGLIPTLAQCDYIDSMPESDQAFMDNDTFLPSAIARYHQLFMPAIQVVDGILAVLGSKHTTATNQALNFLSSHGSTVAILLKTDTDYVTLAMLEEIHLLVTMCAVLLPTVPKTDLLSANSGFGVIHAAILALSTRSLEMQASGQYAFGFGSRSKFDVLVEKKERLLRKSVIAYIGAASEFTEPEITLILSPVTITPKREDQASRFSATVPTIGEALASLDDVCNDLAEILRQISDIGAELAHKDRLSLTDVQEILRDYDSSILQELEVDQTRSLIYRELKRIRKSLIESAKVILDSNEMLLLLIWRHLQYYAEPRNAGVPPARGASVSNAMRLLATTDPNVFRNEVGAKLQPVLHKLSSIELTATLSGKEWQESQGYVQIMCRRLKDSAGLLVEEQQPQFEYE